MNSALVIAAMPLELKWVRERADVQWIRRIEGPGPRLAGRAADEAGPVAEIVISAGLCGGLDPGLQVGDIVVGTAVNGIRCDIPSGVDLKRTVTGPVASVDYIAGLEQKRELRRTGAIAVEMEAAAVLDRARRWGKKFYCIKAVSDVADERFSLDLNAARDESGRFRVTRILGQAACRPWVGLPELLRLKRNSESAARALGDFLANCRF